MQNNIFIGRKKELKLLEELYNSQKFEMLILRGRIKVGKSYLLNHFSKKYQNNTVFFTADKSAEKSNVKSFCEELNNVLKFGTFLNSFETWKDVFSFFKDIELKQRLVIIIDEFTYLHSSNPAFDSILQNAIDRVLKQKNVFLILCGSEVSTIEDIIDDSTKPLYGRKTAELKLEPFSYLEAKEFFPKYSNEEALTVYSILGGTPLYLSLFDDSLSIRENIIKNCLSTKGYLFNEVENLLRMELKETSFYKNIMLAINSGASNLNTIRDKVGEDSAKISKYISVLINLGYIKKEIPCGEKDRIRNTLYSISDNYFAFYFAFIFKHRNILNGFISPEIFYEKEMTNEKLNAFIGKRFEDICKAYLKQQFYLGKMPFYPQEIGRWWGNNPILKKQEEIDILALDDENAIICECKYTNEKFDLKQLKDLEQSALCINKENKSFIIFSKSGVTTKVEELIIDDSNYKVLTIEDLYR